MRPSCLAPLLLVAGCADWGGSFTTRFAPAFAPAGHSVSVLAVYVDGRMSSAGWERLAPALAADFAGGPCRAGYDALIAAKPDLADAVDERAREDGPTDELLAVLAPAAQGDLILVITEARPMSQGLAPRPGGRTRRSPSNILPPHLAAGRFRSRGPSGAAVMPGGDPDLPGGDAEALEISAHFYSVQEKQSVADVSLQYTGADLDRALAELAKKLGASMPAMRCAAWTWDANLDPAQIRQSEDAESQ
jgi:hypothetical protein